VCTRACDRSIDRIESKRARFNKNQVDIADPNLRCRAVLSGIRNSRSLAAPFSPPSFCHPGEAPFALCSPVKGERQFRRMEKPRGNARILAIPLETEAETSASRAAVPNNPRDTALNLATSSSHARRRGNNIRREYAAVHEPSRINTRYFRNIRSGGRFPRYLPYPRAFPLLCSSSRPSFLLSLSGRSP